MTCKCGATATVQLEVTLRSTQGYGTRVERPECVRCADRTAFTALADGAVSAVGRRVEA